MPDPTETPLILDTHSWIWLLDGEGSLGSSPFVSEAEAASIDGRLYICSISIAEVALLVSAGRVRLVVPVTTWLREALETPGLQVIDIDIGVAAEAAALPGEFPGDTADRMIVAATRLTGGRLATADPRIQLYGEEGYVSVLSLENRSGG
jgi:PIN domain nuclease of toxin-antitoxin system